MGRANIAAVNPSNLTMTHRLTAGRWFATFELEGAAAAAA